MSIIIFHYVFDGQCDHSDDHILELLEYIPETAGKEIVGEVQRLQINEVHTHLADGYVYLINDRNIDVSGIYVMFERMFNQDDPEFVSRQDLRQSAASETLLLVMDQLDVPVTMDDLVYFIGPDGTLGYHVNVDNSTIRDELSKALHSPFKIIQDQQPPAQDQFPAPSPEKISKLYQLAASAQVDLRLEYMDGSREWSIVVSSPCEEERLDTGDGSFDTVADIALEHLEKLQSRMY